MMKIINLLNFKQSQPLFKGKRASTMLNKLLSQVNNMKADKLTVLNELLSSDKIFTMVDLNKKMTAIRQLKREQHKYHLTTLADVPEWIYIKFR